MQTRLVTNPHLQLNHTCEDLLREHNNGSILGKIIFATHQGLQQVSTSFELIHDCNLIDVTPAFGEIENQFGHPIGKPLFSKVRLHAMHMIDFQRDLKVFLAEQSPSNIINDAREQRKTVNPHIASLDLVSGFKDRQIRVVYTSNLQDIRRMRRAFQTSKRRWLIRQEAPRKVYCGNALTAFTATQDVHTYLHYVVFCRLTGTFPLPPDEWNRRGRR